MTPPLQRLSPATRANYLRTIRKIYVGRSHSDVALQRVIIAMADGGFGDWSAIRDSSDATVIKMFNLIRERERQL